MRMRNTDYSIGAMDASTASTVTYRPWHAAAAAHFTTTSSIVVAGWGRKAMGGIVSLAAENGMLPSRAYLQHSS